jgi:hypothetical protein
MISGGNVVTKVSPEESMRSVQILSTTKDIPISYQLQRVIHTNSKDLLYTGGKIEKSRRYQRKVPTVSLFFFLFNSADPEKTCPDVPILKGVFQVTGEQKQIEEDKVPRETISMDRLWNMRVDGTSLKRPVQPRWDRSSFYHPNTCRMSRISISRCDRTLVRLYNSRGGKLHR